MCFWKYGLINRIVSIRDHCFGPFIRVDDELKWWISCVIFPTNTIYFTGMQWYLTSTCCNLTSTTCNLSSTHWCLDEKYTGTSDTCVKCDFDYTGDWNIVFVFVMTSSAHFNALTANCYYEFHVQYFPQIQPIN